MGAYAIAPHINGSLNSDKTKLLRLNRTKKDLPSDSYFITLCTVDMLTGLPTNPSFFQDPRDSGSMYAYFPLFLYEYNKLLLIKPRLLM